LDYVFEDGLGQSNKLTLYLDGRNPPEVNGACINLAPASVYDCPYLTSDHRSGVITVQKAPRKMTLDFNRDEIMEERF